MASYLITGVSRGLGVSPPCPPQQRPLLTQPQFEFLTQLSSNPANTVFGLVRDKAATDKKVKAELGSRANVHIVEADVTNYNALKVRQTSTYTPR